VLATTVCSCDCRTSWTCFGEERDQRNSPGMTHERLKIAGMTLNRCVLETRANLVYSTTVISFNLH
jgi:hypothetical protein